jgi:hypothetical protein
LLAQRDKEYATFVVEMYILPSVLHAWEETWLSKYICFLRVHSEKIDS